MIGTWLSRRLPPRTFDAVIALLLLAVTVVVVTHPGRDNTGSPAAAAIALAAVASGSLMFRRTRPRTVAAVTVGCGTGIGVLGYGLTPVVVGATVVALYTLAVSTDRRTAQLATAGTLLLFLTTAVVFDPADVLGPERVGMVAWVLLPGAVGDSIRTRRDYVAAVEARAELAISTREEEALRRVGEERVRIARELHDVVAHHLALANAQAGAASYLLSRKPEQAQEVMDNLAGTTASALRELKATVGLLRQTGDSDSPLEPAPGLAQLADLIASFGRAGLTVELTVDGEPQTLSPGVDLTAYRIVQEALTNVAKHAGTRTAAVRLDYTRDRLAVTVRDFGRGPAGTGPPGFGLIGMRERAGSVGGSLSAGPGPGGGFEVTTELPLQTKEKTPR